MRLPSREQCFALLEKYGVDENIVRHSVQVSRVAVFLAERLLAAREALSLGLVETASLLHDIDKRLTLSDDSKRHALESKRILLKEGFPEIAEIVAKHRLSYILVGRLESWEEKLVYYADKRVMHDRIVSLEKRFAYLLERYGSKSPKIRAKIIACKPHVFRLEREIFDKAKVDKSLSELKRAPAPTRSLLK